MTEPSAGPDPSAPRDAEPGVPLAVGRPVWLRLNGRRGIIKTIVDPPRAGRSFLVVWDGSADYSLVSPHEVEERAVDAAAAKPAASLHEVDGDAGD